MFCRNCGTCVDGNKFCPNCGMPCNNEVNYNNVNNNSNDNNGILIGSVLIGVVSIILIFYIWLLALPIAIVGLIFGFIAFKKTKRVVGIVINAISIGLNVIFTVLVFLFLGAFFGILFSYVDEVEDYINDNDNDTVISEPVKESNPLIGTWDCVNYPDGVNSEYTTTMVLDKSYNFETYEYGNKENNHIYGTYEFEDLDKKNNSGEYSYYTLEIKPNEYVIDSEYQDFDENTLIKFEFGIATIDGVKQGILLNYANYNMIYCFVR